MKPKRTAKQIVLELLTAADSHQGSVANLVLAADLLGVDGNSVRVALARLVAAGTLELAGRGEYRLAAGTRALTEQVTSWRELEKTIRKWDGGWVCVQLGDVGRTDRSALRRRERALRLHGFRPLDKTLEVRPDNLAGGIDGLRERLRELGLEDRALMFRATDFDPAAEARARALWDGERLTQTYRSMTARIDRFVVAVGELPERAAAREAFLFGSDVLKMLVVDPRLPEPLVEVGARKGLVDAMKRLDGVGRGLWARVFGMPYRFVVPATEDGHVYS